MRTHPQRRGETQRQRTVLEVLYGQAKQRQVDRDWKIAVVALGLFMAFPNVMIVGFVILAMYIAGGWKGILGYAAIVAGPLLIVGALIKLGVF